MDPLTTDSRSDPKTPPIEGGAICHPHADALAHLPRANRRSRGRGNPPSHIKALAPVAPPDGESPYPPDDVPQGSFLAAHTGPWGPLTSQDGTGPSKWGEFSEYVEEGVNVRRLDQQLGVLARHLMLEALWDREGWATKKERFDACVAAVKTVEGAKGELWIQAGPKKDWTQEEYNKERLATEDRLRKLLAAQRRGEGVTPGQVVEAATKVIDVEVDG